MASLGVLYRQDTYPGLPLSPRVQLPCSNYKMSYVIMKVPYCSSTSGISDNVITSPYKTIINQTWETFFFFFLFFPL